MRFERYPDLKANENFKELINELERTETASTWSAIDLIPAREFNTKINQFPTQTLLAYWASMKSLFHRCRN